MSQEQIKAFAEWADWLERHQKLAQLPLSSRLHLAAQSSQGLSKVLEFVEQHVFQGEEPAEGLATIVDCLEDIKHALNDPKKGVSELEGIGQEGSTCCSHGTNFASQHSREEQLSYLVGGGSWGGRTSAHLNDALGLLINGCAQEMGVPNSVVSQMLRDYETSLQRIDVQSACAEMFGEA